MAAVAISALLNGKRPRLSAYQTGTQNLCASEDHPSRECRVDHRRTTTLLPAQVAENRTPR